MTPRLISAKPIAAAFLLGDADVAGHGDFQAAADGVAVDRRNDDLRGVFQAHEHFVAVQREVVFETERLAREHVDVGAGGEKLFDLAGDDDGVDIVVEAGVENRRVQFFE